MPRFSTTSSTRLESCDPRLRSLLEAVVAHYDCTILEGHRDQETQDRYFKKGRSRVRWPDGMHNSRPSMAVDVAPYPVDWDDKQRFYLFSGYVLGTARQMGIRLRWGGDWDGDWDIADQTFNDLVHFELKDD